MLTIRPEQPADREQVFQVNQQAFGQPDEARLVEALHRSPAFIPELSLVAVDDERVVGHILLSRVAVRGETTRLEALALAPMAVLPARHVGASGRRWSREGSRKHAVSGTAWSLSWVILTITRALVSSGVSRSAFDRRSRFRLGPSWCLNCSPILFRAYGAR